MAKRNYVIDIHFSSTPHFLFFSQIEISITICKDESYIFDSSSYCVNKFRGKNVPFYLHIYLIQIIKVLYRYLIQMHLVYIFH